MKRHSINPDSRSISASSIIEAEISGLSNDGRGVAFLSQSGMAPGRGMALFVAGALPGQIIQCKIDKIHKNFLEAKLLAVSRDASQKQPPICPHYQECGGCPMQPLPYAQQLNWKGRMVQDAMRRIGGIKNLSGVWGGIEPAPRRVAFRNKIELAFGADEHNRLVAGYRRRESHEVRSISHCAIVDDPANRIIQALGTIASSMPWSDFWRFFILRKPDEKTSAWTAICITSPGSFAQKKLARKLAKELLRACPELHAFIHEEGGANSLKAAGKKRIFVMDNSRRENPEAAVLSMRLGDRDFKLDARSFFQVNSEGAEKLLALIRANDEAFPAEDGRLVDLYCGVGAPGLCLAKNHDFIFGVEADPLAIDFARINAQNSGDCRYVCGDAAKIFASGEMASIKKPGTVLLDPPRSGLAPEALQGLLTLEPEKLIYISCNAATMARDAAKLAPLYKLEALKSVDLFPHTPHVENCGVWTRK